MNDRPAGAHGHMSAEEFRSHGHRVVDMIADYWDWLRSDSPPPVRPSCEPGSVRRAVPARAPEHGDAFDAILEDVRRVVMPNLTHWQHPGFFAYFPANGSGPAVLGDLLSTGLGVNGMLWATSPACTEIEQVVVEMMADALGLPARFRFGHKAGANDPSGAAAWLGAGSEGGGGGCIQGTASESTLVALLAALHRSRGFDPRMTPVAYCSNQAHSSVVKGAMVAGMHEPGGGVRVRQVACRGDGSMDVSALRRAMVQDVSAGLTPVMVCATLGTTGVMAFDDLREITGAVDSLARPTGSPPVWLHADAAMAGAAWVCPELRGPLAGAERLDSLCFNPHKWLLTSFDCGLLWTSDVGSLTGALSITPEYLRNAASSAGGVVDYRDWQVPLGRRFRALKLWFVLRSYGLANLRSYIRAHLSHAQWLEDQATSDRRFAVWPARRAGSPLVCLHLAGYEASAAGRGAQNAATARLMEAVNATGAALLSHTTVPSPQRGLEPVYLVRVAIGGTFTERGHVESVWRVLCEQAGRLGR